MTSIQKADSAERAHKNFTDIKSIRAHVVTNFIELGRLFKVNHEKEYYKVLGHETFDEFLGDPELGFGRTAVKFFIKVYERYIQSLDIPKERLLRCSWTKLQIVEPFVKTIGAEDKSKVEEWLYKAETLSCSDLKLEVNEALGRPDTPASTRISPPDAPGSTILGGAAWYRGVVKKSPCLLHPERKSQGHHFPRTKGAGADDWKMIPLCPECHREAHDGGTKWLWENRVKIFDWFYNLLGHENEKMFTSK